ncbi:MAG TPA: redoxin family protein, partial [Planctomycetaceae bacterium]|nr:redoxin family protein [Planctomycetaceae bacterium]
MRVWAVRLGALLATLMLGCSGGGGPSTTSGDSPAKSRQDTSAQEAVSSPPAAPAQETKAAPAQETKAAPTAKSGNVSVQSVTAEEFKKIIAAQKGNVVLVDFWATWCGPCREKFPQTLALAKKYASQGLTVVSVSMDSPDPKDQEKVLHFLQQQNAQIINLANRMDDSEAAFGAFDIDGGALPHYKIFDRKGNPGRKFGGDPDHPFDEKDIPPP